MQRHLRIIRLLSLARLRSAGWAPWLLLLGWLVLAAAQEPRMLRRFGIYLIDDAAWIGGLLMACILLAAQRRLPRVGAVAANLTTLVVVGLGVMLVCRMLDQGPWSESSLSRIYDATGFVGAWAPLAICTAREPRGDRAAAILHYLVVLASLLTGSILATALRAQPSATSWGAACLAIAAAACWTTRPRTL